MEERMVEFVGLSATKVGTTIADLKLRVAEHIITQADCYVTDDVWNILAETKVGSQGRQALLEKLKVVFSMS